jgi:hypothetical protein
VYHFPINAPHVVDGLHLETPDEPTTLEQDLLEDSDRAFHRAVTLFQKEQAGHYHDKMRKVLVWLAQEIKKPTANRQQAEDAVHQYDWEMREAIHRDREQFADAMRAVKEQRDRLILLFCQTRHGGA